MELALDVVEQGERFAQLAETAAIERPIRGDLREDPDRAQDVAAAARERQRPAGAGVNPAAGASGHDGTPSRGRRELRG